MHFHEVWLQMHITTDQHWLSAFQFPTVNNNNRAHTRELLAWKGKKKLNFMHVPKILWGNKSDTNKINVIDVIFV